MIPFFCVIPRSLRLGLLTLIVSLAPSVSPLSISAPSVSAFAQSPRWTTSQVRGTPDPPPPYTIERVCDGVNLERPTEMVWCEPLGRWFSTAVRGQVHSFTGPDDFSLALDLRSVAPEIFQAYGITFHPRFPDQPWCYLCYAAKRYDPLGTRLSRFRVAIDGTPRIDPASETVLLQWESSGHGGGSVHFGPRDGFLYVSVGDGHTPNPPDPSETGQDRGDLEASILRIDVDHTGTDSAGQPIPYRIPEDNPFVGQEGIRGEIWAFGFRNPWKMAFDPITGDLWAGDVGWEMREMVYRIERGANYGWSIMEGSQRVKPDQQPVIPITPPVVEHDHVESRSITGGYVWNHPRLPELAGAYVYGDWMTGKIWAVKTDGDRVVWHRELADTSLQIICFALTRDGEIWVVGYDGTIHRLVANEPSQVSATFPRRLSETGLFASTADQRPAPGVLPYSINARAWADGTTSRQWIGLPPGPALTVFEKSNWEVGQVKGFVSFPPNTVLAKTIAYQTDATDPDSSRNLETQLLHRSGDDWQAYNYVWNDDQTDAILQDNVATDRKLVIADPSAPNGRRSQTWHHASRDECLLCHIWSAGTVHGFKLQQLHRPAADIDPLQRLTDSGFFAERPKVSRPTVSPHDTSASLDDRARSYLNLNCAHCHRRGGGGTAAFVLADDVPMDQMGIIDAVPTQGDFGLDDARVVAPAAPHRSVLLYRLAKSGRGHMPQFGSNRIDESGIQLVHDWIAAMPPSDPSQSLPVIPDSMAEAQIAQRFGSVSSSLALSVACGRTSMSPETRAMVVASSTEHSDSRVRELFERFVPESQRVVRLGDSIDPESLLQIKGDPVRGKHLFVDSKDVSCRLCHPRGRSDPSVGPALDGLGARQSPAQILDSILNPSAKIAPEYQTTAVLTVDGAVITGIRQPDAPDGSVRVLDSQGNVHQIDDDDIDAIRSLPESIMPARLLSGFTAQQAADLLAYLSQTNAAP